MPLSTTTDRFSTLYEEKRDAIVAGMKQLPPNEFSYYMALLVSSIENENDPKKYTLLLLQIEELVNALVLFYSVPLKTEENTSKVTLALHHLIDASKMQKLPHQIKETCLKVCSVVMMILVGVLAGATGAVVGLFSDYTLLGNLRSASLGFLSGFVFGLFIGSRIPDKLCMSAFESELEFCIKSIDRLGVEFQNRTKRPEDYQAETKQHIMDVFFINVPVEQREAAFNDFLNNKNQTFQLCTTTAGHISSHLKGYLGHHSLIRYKINGVQSIPIEFGDRKRTPNFVDQYESERHVTGQKLFDMLVLDRILQETHESNARIIATYEIGSNDCRTYVDKILIGTHQPPTKLSRFNDEIDKWSGNLFVGPLLQTFSKIPENLLFPFIKHFADGNNPTITAQKWTSNKDKKETSVPSTKGFFAPENACKEWLYDDRNEDERMMAMRMGATAGAA